MVTISISGYPSTWFLFIPSTNGIIPTIILMISLNDVWYVFSRYSKKEKGTEGSIKCPCCHEQQVGQGCTSNWKLTTRASKEMKNICLRTICFIKFHSKKWQIYPLPVALSSQLVDKYFQMPGVYSLFSSTDSIRWWYE